MEENNKSKKINKIENRYEIRFFKKSVFVSLKRLIKLWDFWLD